MEEIGCPDTKAENLKPFTYTVKKESLIPFLKTVRKKMAPV